MFGSSCLKTLSLLLETLPPFPFSRPNVKPRSLEKSLGPLTINPIASDRNGRDLGFRSRKILSHGPARLKSLSPRHRAGPDGDADWHIPFDVNGSQKDTPPVLLATVGEKERNDETTGR